MMADEHAVADKVALYRCMNGHVHLEILDMCDRQVVNFAMDLSQAMDLHVALSEAIRDLAEQMSEGRG